jgi:large subunit ribosomal protein L9
MRVLLLDNIKGTGKKSEIVDVSDGYALNYLFPRHLAIKATKGAMKDLATKNETMLSSIKKHKEENQKLADILNNRLMVLRVKCGESGKLFGSITTKDIANEIKKQFELSIDKKQIVVDDSLKSLGKKVIEIKFQHDVTAKLYLKIEKE